MKAPLFAPSAAVYGQGKFQVFLLDNPGQNPDHKGALWVLQRRKEVILYEEGLQGLYDH